MKRFLLLAATIVPCLMATGQQVQKFTFNSADSASGYYLAIPPSSGDIRAVLVVFCAFRGPESILPETKLHNVAAANDMLTIYASIGRRVLPNLEAMEQMNKVFQQVVAQFKPDTAMFAVGGYDVAGMAVLRYAEQALTDPERWAIRPKAVFDIAGPVDLGALVHLSERQIKKNYSPPAMADAKAILDFVRAVPAGGYETLSPFNGADPGPGNEQALRHAAVRLYFDTDIEWQLSERRNGYYDTYLPDAAEMVNRLMLEGNKRAEFISSRQPGMRSNGMRRPSAYNIVDEVDCIQWIIKTLHVFTPSNPSVFQGPYHFGLPEGWRIERYTFPPPFAPDVQLKGIEEIRFPPGWGVAGSNDYFSVSFLLWLDGGQIIDEPTLQEMFRRYFDGLIKTGIAQNARDKIVPTKVQIKKIKPEPDDLETYAGTIEMIDYMAVKPLRQNVLVHIKICADRTHIPVFFEMSPRPYDDVLWTDLKRRKQQFSLAD
jgi:hypothetical protein